MSQLSRVDEAADILTRLFNGLAQLSGKQLSARQREAIHRACELLAEGEPLDELAEFDDIAPATMPRLNPNNAQYKGWGQDAIDQAEARRVTQMIDREERGR